MNGSTIWREYPPLSVSAELLAAGNGSRLLAEALARRGITSEDQAKAFLDANLYQPTSAFDLPDMEKAVARILQALQKGEVVGVWGDFDADGQTATTILVEGFEKLGLKTVYHIPIRAEESHGVGLRALTPFLPHCQLLVTCDTGVTAHEAVLYAAAQGVDTIITDHHSLPDELPPAYAVINSQRLPSDHPLSSLCGAGCAYKLLEALFQTLGREKETAQFLDLCAIGTIADLAPLKGDNRYLVQQGLEVLKYTQRAGLIKLMQAAEVEINHLNEQTISFAIAPRLNALGRLSDANSIVQLFTSQDKIILESIVHQLIELNEQRKLLCSQVFGAAQSLIEQNPALLENPVLILSHPHWPGGVIGIVASELVEMYQRPTLLIATPEGQAAHGSARSVSGINITAALAENQHLLNSFGGHPMAAGFSLESANIEKLQKALNRTVSELEGVSEKEAELIIDAFLPLEETSLEVVEALEKLAPFGPGNPPLTFACRKVEIKKDTPIGKNKDHRMVLVETGAGSLHKVLWWKGAGMALPEKQFDLAYQLRSNTFQGNRQVQVTWIAARKTEEKTILIPESTLPFEIIDQRKVPDPIPAIQALLDKDKTEVWYEGVKLTEFAYSNRYEVAKVSQLILYGAPAERSILKKICQSAVPQKVFLFSAAPVDDTPAAFLTRLSGLIQYALKRRAGRVTIAELCGACSQREATVLSGLDWLCAKGFICYTKTENQLLLRSGEKADPQAENRLTLEITGLLEETAAYRAFYQKADPRSVFKGIAKL